MIVREAFCIIAIERDFLSSCLDEPISQQAEV